MTGVAPRHLQAIERWTLILSALVIAAAFLAAPRATAFAIAVACGLMNLNAWALRRIAARVMERAGEVKPGVAILLLVVKMGLLVALVFLCVTVMGLDAIGFLIGV